MSGCEWRLRVKSYCLAYRFWVAYDRCYAFGYLTSTSGKSKGLFGVFDAMWRVVVVIGQPGWLSSDRYGWNKHVRVAHMRCLLVAHLWKWSFRGK